MEKKSAENESISLKYNNNKGAIKHKIKQYIYVHNLGL